MSFSLSGTILAFSELRSNPAKKNPMIIEFEPFRNGFNSGMLFVPNGANL